MLKSYTKLSVIKPSRLLGILLGRIPEIGPLAIGTVLQVMRAQTQLTAGSFPMTPVAESNMATDPNVPVPTILGPTGNIPLLPGSEQTTAIARSSGSASSGAPNSGDTPEKLLLREQVQYLEWKNQETKVGIY